MDYVQARQQILERLADRSNKSVDELVGWQDYDPIMVDEAAHNMVRQSRGTYSNWAGD